MSKNIILCSDGTGNRGGRLGGTNVWRLYQAIEHHPANGPEQVAFHDDGVGTEDLKILRLIGGAFGYGISRNLCQLYGFLMRHYEPGDPIYLFGFSRGAFTIRLLAHLIHHCGIARCNGLTPREIDGRAEEALDVFKCRFPEKQWLRKRIFHRLTTDQFKADYGQLNGANPVPSKDIPIQFIGVWDTVDAVGMPIDEMTEGLIWLFPLRFQKGKNGRESDLHPEIKHARHALSVDDERQTFSPTLWNPAKLDRAKQTLKQVWFPGVHSNVGGGYEKDQLSLVTLIWMMEEAATCGLNFIPSLVAEFRRDADVDGQIYDSRAGLAAYYRYKPRDIAQLCRDAQEDVCLHSSVLERVHHGTDDYAPAQIPQTYFVENSTPGTPVEAPADAARRAGQHELATDVIWWRRVFYHLFLIWTLALVAYCWKFSTADRLPDIGAWTPLERGLYELFGLVGKPLDWMTPAYFKPWLAALQHHPYALSGFLLALAGITSTSVWLVQKSRNLSRRGWVLSLHIGNCSPGGIGVSTRSWWIALAHAVRTSRLAAWLVDFKASHAPWVTLAGMVGVGAALFTYLVPPPFSLAMNPDAPRATELRGAAPATASFGTTNSLKPTEIILVKGEKYRFNVTVKEPWLDWNTKADASGLKDENLSLTHWLMSSYRRSTTNNWFKLMGCIGPDAGGMFPIGTNAVLRAERTGRLYLFVNDAFGFYWNNQGTADVRVECLTPEP